MNRQIKLCACGCGKQLLYIHNTYISGHNRKGAKNSKESIQKLKDTCFKKYGVTNPLQVKNIKLKMMETMKTKYGFKHALQVPRFQNKFKKTNLYKFGREYPVQTKEIQEKMKTTCMDHFGYHFNVQTEEFQNKRKQTQLIKYGVDSSNKYPDIKRKLRIHAIKRIENQLSNNEPLMPNIGNNERIFLNELQKYTQFNIIRNDPSFRYQIGRFPDGHIPEVKLFIQFDESHHFSDKECTQYREEDIQCTKDLESISGYRVFRVSEREWNENQNLVIKNFQFLLNS